MTRLLFLGLGHLSRGDVSIAADVARQLPRSKFTVAFITTADVVTNLRELGLPAIALDGTTPEANLSIVDRVVADFKPDTIVAADAFTLNYSVVWSGLNVRIVRERYPVPLASFDQYDWRAADYVVDFYGYRRKGFPRLLESCDLLIRNCPLNRPQASAPGVLAAALGGGGLRDGGLRPRLRTEADRRGQVPVVFLANSKWEYVDVNKRAGSTDMRQLIDAMPRILHSHLAALGKPLSIVHIGPVPWRFRIADHIHYQHLAKLPPASFFEQMVNCDLYLTTNQASVTLSHAALAGVPALNLYNDRALDVAGAGRDIPELSWLSEAAPGMEVIYPFRVCPWGWYEFLTPVLSDNPYTDCFRSASVLDRDGVLAALNQLLYDREARTSLHHRQISYREQLAQMPSLAETFDLEMAK